MAQVEQKDKDSTATTTTTTTDPDTLKKMVANSVMKADMIVECEYSNKLVSLPEKYVAFADRNPKTSISVSSVYMGTKSVLIDSCASTCCAPSILIASSTERELSWDDVTVIKGISTEIVLAPIINSKNAVFAGLKNSIPLPFAAVDSGDILLGHSVFDVLEMGLSCLHEKENKFLVWYHEPDLTYAKKVCENTYLDMKSEFQKLCDELKSKHDYEAFTEEEKEVKYTVTELNEKINKLTDGITLVAAKQGHNTTNAKGHLTVNLLKYVCPRLSMDKIYTVPQRMIEKHFETFDNKFK